MHLFLVLALLGQDIPIGSEPVKIGAHEAKADHTPYRSSWVPATSEEMLHALKSFSDMLGGKLGYNPRLHELERFIHYVGHDSPIRPKYERNGITEFGWWGHCNGESAAATLESNPPLNGVTRTINGKTLTIPQDQLQALLAESYYEANAMSRGTRSFLSETQFVEAKKLLEASGATSAQWRAWYKSTFRNEAPAGYGTAEIQSVARRGVVRFEDMNPGEFHRTLRTVMGKAKIPMVIETAAGEAVWNWPAWAYKTDVRPTTRTTAGGLKVLDVTTTVETGAGPKTYTYELHVDSRNVIRNGAWTGGSVTNHPDFVWSATDPRFRLNEFMAKAITNNVTLDMTEAQIASAVRTGDRAGLKQLKSNIRDVMSKTAPAEVIEPAKLTDSMYRKTVDLVRKWNADPTLKWRYGSLENYLESGLATSLGRGKRFGVDLYKELAEVLPADHRAVSDVEARLRKAAADPTPMDRAGSMIKREAAGLGQFAAAFLLKEGFKAIETRDPSRMKEAALQLKEPGFWGSLAVFSAASRVTEVAVAKLPLPGLAKGLGRAALPLAAGMAAVQLMSGQASLKDVLIGTGAYLATGFAVNLLADSLIYPALFAAGPPGWIAAGVYTVAKLAVTLYLGEKLEGWLHGLFGGKDRKAAGAPRGGVKEKIERVAP